VLQGEDALPDLLAIIGKSQWLFTKSRMLYVLLELHSRRASRSIQEESQQGEGFPSQQLGTSSSCSSILTGLEEQQSFFFRVSSAVVTQQSSSSASGCARQQSSSHVVLGSPASSSDGAGVGVGGRTSGEAQQAEAQGIVCAR
jgi:hypothetical protein